MTTIIDNGFVKISLDIGPDTTRVTILQRIPHHHEMIFALSEEECDAFADALRNAP